MAGSVIYGALHPSGGEAWLRESPPAISRALCTMWGPKGVAAAIGSRSGKNMKHTDRLCVRMLTGAKHDRNELFFASVVCFMFGYMRGVT